MTGSVRNVYRGKVLKLNIERVKLPNGTVAELEIAHHPGGAVVVALDADERVCLLRQFRHAVRRLDHRVAGRQDRQPRAAARMRAGASWPRKQASRRNAGTARPDFQLARAY
jgi:hypothetical protein